MRPVLKWIARRLAPHMARELAGMPRYFGDRSRVSIGADVTLMNTLFSTTAGRISVGDFSFFGHGVSLITGTHDVKSFRQARKAYADSGRDIVIGRGVWIATEAVVLGPCEIGDDAVVAAGAVLLPGIYEGRCVYGGVPAKLLSRIPAGDGPA